MQLNWITDKTNIFLLYQSNIQCIVYSLNEGSIVLIGFDMDGMNHVTANLKIPN